MSTRTYRHAISRPLSTIRRAFAGGVALALAAGLVSATPPAFAEPSGSGGAGGSPSSGTTTPAVVTNPYGVTFGGSTLNDSLVSTMAAAEGDDLLGWKRCKNSSGYLNDCVNLMVGTSTKWRTLTIVSTACDTGNACYAGHEVSFKTRHTFEMNHDGTLDYGMDVYVGIETKAINSLTGQVIVSDEYHSTPAMSLTATIASGSSWYSYDYTVTDINGDSYSGGFGRHVENAVGAVTMAGATVGWLGLKVGFFGLALGVPGTPFLVTAGAKIVNVSGLVDSVYWNFETWASGKISAFCGDVAEATCDLVSYDPSATQAAVTQVQDDTFDAEMLSLPSANACPLPYYSYAQWDLQDGTHCESSTPVWYEEAANGACVEVTGRTTIVCVGPG
jgi:hypothetical protein